MNAQRTQLPEFIEILLPTRDRNGKPLSAVKQREWQERIASFLLERLQVTGFQESNREGVWKQEQRNVRKYNPRTDRLYLVRETIHVMRTNCTRSQIKAFRREGEALLVEMSKALNQEAVAYETRDGLTILTR